MRWRGGHYRLGFKAAVGLHAGLLALLLVSAFAGRGCGKRIEITEIEFLVEVPAAEAAAPDTLAGPVPPPPDPEERPDPDPVPDPEEPPPPAPRQREPIRVSRNRVRREVEPEPSRPTLSEEELKRLLREGATPADRTVDPGEDARCLARLREALYGAWAQPSAGDVGPRPVVMEISLGAGGTIVDRRLRESSGSPAMDDSVLRAVASVSRVPGLTPGFISRHTRLSIEFRVQ